MERRSGFLREGDQYVLDLFPGLPWAGRSPRALTQGKKLLYLRREPPGHEVEMDLTQLTLWGGSVRPPWGRRPQPAAGAPPLLLLKAAKRRIVKRYHTGGY